MNGADHGYPERTVHVCIKFNFDTKPPKNVSSR